MMAQLNNKVILDPRNIQESNYSNNLVLATSFIDLSGNQSQIESLFSGET